MLTYEYSAKDPKTGKKVKSIIQANNEHVAAKLISEQGLSPLDIKLQTESNNNFAAKYLNRVKMKDKVLFSRQLSTLINAGLPLVQSLHNVANQTANKHLKIVIQKIIIDVESGISLSESLKKYPDIFNDVFVNLVAAGEASGTLDKSLQRLADQQEKDAEIISKVRGALIYPAIVIIVMIAVVGFMVIKVLPQVEELYISFNAINQLPIVTKILIAFSHFLSKYWWLILILIITAIFFGTRWARTITGKSAIDKFKMRSWPFGKLFMKMYMARFARTGATLISAGVPLIESLEIIAKSVNNIHIEASLKRAITQVTAGKSLSSALRGDPNFLELVPSMLDIGETSGTTEEMMDKTAYYYEHEVDNEIKAIQTTIEPTLMIILGIVALVIVVAVLLPIYSLAGKGIIK